MDHVYPGVSPQAELQPGEEKVYHKYYMWVALVLACQTAMFMIPRYIWKSSEGGKIRMLIQGLMEPIIDDDTKADQIKLIVKYFRLNRGTHVSIGCVIQGSAKRWVPGCVNAEGKARQKWLAIT